MMKQTHDRVALEKAAIPLSCVGLFFGISIRNDAMRDTRKQHKASNTTEYNSWRGIRDRCKRPSHASYKYYGGRGITVCDRWRKFENFHEDMGDKPFPEAQIDRIDNDSGYCPENCRWVTPKENSLNRRSNIKIFFEGKELSLQECEEMTGIPWKLIWQRLFTYGWGVKDAIFTPLRKKGKVVFKGRRQYLDHWCEELNLNQRVVSSRVRRLGWSVERALTTPTKGEYVYNQGL